MLLYTSVASGAHLYGVKFNIGIKTHMNCLCCCFESGSVSEMTLCNHPLLFGEGGAVLDSI